MGIFSSKCTNASEPANPAPKAKQANEHDRAVLQLKVPRDKLTKLKKKLDLEVDTQDNLARDLVKQKKKDRALLILKRKKWFLNQYGKADGELTNVKEMLTTLEFAKTQNEVLECMNGANKALQALQEQMSLDDAERIMDESAEGIEYANDLSEIVGQGLTVQDDDALAEELDKIWNADAGATSSTKEPATEEPVTLPTIPSGLQEVPEAEPEPANRGQAMLA